MQADKGGVYVSDILSQPERLEALDRAAASRAARPLLADAGRFSRIILTGMGASHAALRPLWIALLGEGRAAWLMETSELLSSALPLVGRDTLLIIASQSGRSAEIVVAADEVRRRGAVLLALTNDASSPLAAGADAVVDIGAGPEAAVSTRTYLNTLAACLVLERAAKGEGEPDIPAVAAAMAGWLTGFGARVARIRAEIGLPQRLYLLARGASLASAAYGALIAKEAAKHPVEWASSAQFRHGPLEMADERLTAVLLMGEDTRERELNAALGRDLARFGATVVRLDAPPESGPLAIPTPPFAGAGPLLEPLPLQLLTVALAEAAGIEPGVFRHLGKVTTEL